MSSVPFTTLWQHDAQIDSWAAFQEERTSLLNVIHSVPNVIILSGDRHEFAAFEFTGPLPNSNPVFEFSTSPLSMFYVPFIRTLKMASERHVPRRTLTSVTSENGTAEAVEHVEMVPEEKINLTTGA